MNKNSYLLPAITLVAFIQSRDLIFAWRDAPYEHLSIIGFLLWLCPLLIALRARQLTISERISPLTAIGIGLLILKSLTGFNVVAQCGLALILADWLPSVTRERYGNIWFGVWIATALLWMPVMGWVGHSVAPLPLSLIRITIIVIVVVVTGRRKVRGA